MCASTRSSRDARWGGSTTRFCGCGTPLPPRRVGCRSATALRMSSRVDWCARRSSLRCGATSRPIRRAPTIPAAAWPEGPDHRRGVSRNARRPASCGRAGGRSGARWHCGRSAFAPARCALQARQRGLDALAEARVHRLFLLLAVGRTHQQERLAAVGAGAQLGLDAVAHLAPIAASAKLGREALQLALAGSDQIMPLAALQPCDVLGADHAAVHHPDRRPGRSGAPSW